MEGSEESSSEPTPPNAGMEKPEAQAAADNASPTPSGQDEAGKSTRDPPAAAAAADDKAADAAAVEKLVAELAAQLTIPEGLAAKAEAKTPPPAPQDDDRSMIDMLDAVITQFPEKKKEREELLEQVRRRGVRLLINVACVVDPEYSLELLQAAAPRLEELFLAAPRQEHLALVHGGMPRLRRLEIYGDGELSKLEPPVTLTEPAANRLQWLCVTGDFSLPRDLLVTLLRAHADTLEDLQLSVGAPGKPWLWPESCQDLEVLLAQQAGLRKLRSLVVWRGFEYAHLACEQQLRAVRSALPAGVDVRCEFCYRTPIRHIIEGRTSPWRPGL